MGKEKERDEQHYPLRTFHEFLEELDREWDRFRTGSIIGVVLSITLLIFIIRFFLFQILLRPRALLDMLFLLIIIGLLLYSIYSFIEQHKFFKRWERRIGLLLHLEETMLKEALEEPSEE